VIKFFICVLPVVLFSVLTSTRCSIIPVYSYQNKQSVSDPEYTRGQNSDVKGSESVASIDVPWDIDPECRNSLKTNEDTSICKRSDDHFIGISISGGGSRSAVFSAAVLFELDRYSLESSHADLSILKQTDVISSVSGGSLTSAYYALSCDRRSGCPETVEGPRRRIWNEKQVYKKLSKSFQRRWVLNTFWPENFLRLWFTNFDRTDVMAETLSDNLYDNSFFGGESFRFQDLNRQRPNLIINSSDNTENISVNERYFTFTREDFDKIYSDLRRYPIGNAVAASSAYPAVFNYVTLRDYSHSGKRYRHLFDAGTYDNLGLFSIKRIIKNIHTKEKHNPKWQNASKIVFLIDAHTDKGSRKRSDDPEVKGFLQYFVDMSFLDSYDSMLSSLRFHLIDTFHSFLSEMGVKNHPLVVFGFDSLLKTSKDKSIDCAAILKEQNPGDQKMLNLCRFHDRLHRIPTRFRISKKDRGCLILAAKIIVKKEIYFYNQIHGKFDVKEVSEPDEVSENESDDSTGSAPQRRSIEYHGKSSDFKHYSCKIGKKNLTIQDLPGEALAGFKGF